MVRREARGSENALAQGRRPIQDDEEGAVAEGLRGEMNPVVIPSDKSLTDFIE